MAEKKRRKWIWLQTFLLAAVPFSYLLWIGFTGGMGPNPVQRVLHFAGDWTLNFLLLTLFLATLQRNAKTSRFGKLHQPAGRAAFLYGSLHVLVYLVFEQSLNPQFIIEDVIEHKRIIVGAFAFLILLEQVVTSLPSIKRRIQFRKWITLHRFIYLSALAGVIHFLWLVKKDVQKPLYYAAVFVAILLWRGTVWLSRRRATR